tara:strand:- start:168 stop:470 length:303 start_codon:yes stop_codon:yes gene_type:complete
MEKNKKENLIKKNISKSISRRFGLSSSFSSKFLDKIIFIIISGLKKNEKIKIKNFGTFTKNRKKSRIGRNPRNKETFEITERNIISFKASKYLKDKINNE